MIAITVLDDALVIERRRELKTENTPGKETGTRTVRLEISESPHHRPNILLLQRIEISESPHHHPNILLLQRITIYEKRNSIQDVTEAAVETESEIVTVDEDDQTPEIEDQMSVIQEPHRQRKTCLRE